MRREKEFTVKMPKEMEEDFRLFVVLHGGQIEKAKNTEEEEKEEPPVIQKELSQSERCELFGCLIDNVEDWLEKKGITTDMIPNDEREDEDSAIIYGSDYDCLADAFSKTLGIARDVEN